MITRYITLALCLLGTTAFGQSAPERCTSMRHRAERLQAHPEIAQQRQASEAAVQEWLAAHPEMRRQGGGSQIVIPVVVHVLYNNATQNISNAQIQSQIDALNEDFLLRNADSLPANHPFWPFSANTTVEFCLASLDPNGNPTNGITRTFTTVTAFNGNGDEKYSSSGGKDNWDPTRYLNLWVCDLGASGGTLGYATFPDELSQYPNDDGVVIDHHAFGTTGTAGTGGFDVNNLGRTGTHEVGHWLGLFHIWGDNSPFCGDDLVNDTPGADEANYGCPSFPLDPLSSCGTTANGEMYMNYMDYVDDACMVMFTIGQANRMIGFLNTDRSALQTANGCTAVSTEDAAGLSHLILAPNPSNGRFVLQGKLPQGAPVQVRVSDMSGKVMRITQLRAGAEAVIDLAGLQAGIYFVHLSHAAGQVTLKAVLAH